jgi:hypothetical protein
MRRSRSSYHYSLRQVRKDEANIKGNHLAQASVKDPNRNFWAEVNEFAVTKLLTVRLSMGVQ